MKLRPLRRGHCLAGTGVSELKRGAMGPRSPKRKCWLPSVGFLGGGSYRERWVCKRSVCVYKCAVYSCYAFSHLIAKACCVVCDNLILLP